MDITEFQNKLRQVISQLDQDREKDTLLYAKEARALIVRRVQNTGIGSDGSKLGTYSTNPLPVFYHTTILSPSQQKRVKAKNKKNNYKGVSYKEVRNIAGRQTNFVDLTFDGGMWAGTSAQLESADQDTATATITGRDRETLLKLGYNSDRYGNILRLTQEEQTQIATARIERLNNVLRNIF